MMKYLFIVLAFICCISCSETKNPTGEDVIVELQLKGSITGSIIDTDGSPISGVAATLDSAGYDTQSDVNGQYTIPDVPQGAYSITYTHAFHHDTTIHNIAIIEDQDLVISNVVMRKRPVIDSSYGFIKGVVVDSITGVGIAGISVSTESGATDVSGAQGEFFLQQVEVGNQTVSLTSDGYNNIIGLNLLVTALDTLVLDTLKMSVSELGPQGSIVGTVDASIPEGIQILATPTGNIGQSKQAVTDSEGNFLISNLTVAEYQVIAIGGFKSDTVKVSVIEDQNVVVNLLNVVNDLSKVERNVDGDFSEGEQYGDEYSSLNSIDSVLIDVYSQDSSFFEAYKIDYNASEGKFSGIMYIPSNDLTYYVAVKGYDSENRIVYRATQSFNRLSGDVNFTTDDVWNSKPKITGSIVSEVSINDQILLNPSIQLGHDILSSLIIEYKGEGDLNWTSMNLGDSAAAPGIEDLNYTIQIRLTDSEGSQVVKTYLTSVIEDRPTFTWVNPYLLGTNLSGEIEIIATDKYTNGMNFTYEWSDNGIDYAGGDKTKSYQWSTSGNKIIYAKVIDDDGMEFMDSVQIIVHETFTDIRDLKEYTFKQIGTQTWMTENLRHQLGGSWETICRNDDDSECNQYGVFYKYNSMMQRTDFSNYDGWASPTPVVQGVCPMGWHIPSSQELLTLAAYVESIDGSSNTVGGLLRSGTSDWLNLNNPNGFSDEFEFAALPQGHYIPFDIGGAKFRNEGRSFSFWTSTNESYGSSRFHYYEIGDTYDTMVRKTSPPNNASERWLPVRCIMD